MPFWIVILRELALDEEIAEAKADLAEADNCVAYERERNCPDPVQHMTDVIEAEMQLHLSSQRLHLRWQQRSQS